MNEFEISDKILNAEVVSLLMTVSNRDLTFSKNHFVLLWMHFWGVLPPRGRLRLELYDDLMILILMILILILVGTRPVFCHITNETLPCVFCQAYPCARLY